MPDTMPDKDTITEFLAYPDTDGTPPGNLQPLVFGQLAKRASGVIASYHSDLYHDAMWISRWVTGVFTFYWGVDDMGTIIGTDRDLVVQNRRNAYRVRVYPTPKRGWHASITKIR